MPSNKDLTTLADELAEKLGLTIETEGLRNDGLAELVSDLKAKKKDADTQTAADEKPPFYVMPGKSLTSKRGILADGDEIKADDLAGGKDALDAFVDSGHIGKS